MSSLSGKTAVITGAASGIGAATAHLMAQRGASVAVVDISPAGETVAADICGDGGRAQFFAIDVSDETGWMELAHDVKMTLGTVSILHCNAFTHVAAAAKELSTHEWDRQIAVNLTSLFLGTRAFIDQLTETRGSVVATSSVHALVGLPGHPAYAAAKAGMCGLVRQLASEYGPAVRFNAVLPGPILTPQWHDRPEEALRQAGAETVLRRLGTPEEVAQVVAFLASDEASFVTAASVVVDGGWSTFKNSP